MIICCLQFFWTRIVTLQIYWSEIPNKYFVCFMSYFTNILKSPLACRMKHSQGRMPSLSFDSSCFKATCNPQSQEVGEVCLQIYFGSDGFRLWWAVTPSVKTTYLGTVIFNFLATQTHLDPPQHKALGWCHYQRTIATQVVVVELSMWSGLMVSSALSSTKNSKSSEQDLSFTI